MGESKVTQTDILGKQGGEEGQPGSIAAISRLFGGNGVPGIMTAMQAKGMGNEVQSWVRNGKNLPVSGEDIKSVVDRQQLAEMARQQGTTPDELCENIAKVLPNLVDKATPNGQVPKQGGPDAAKGMRKDRNAKNK
jgi:uncharacterized protein YidB (DUF937 family)